MLRRDKGSTARIFFASGVMVKPYLDALDRLLALSSPPRIPKPLGAEASPELYVHGEPRDHCYAPEGNQPLNPIRLTHRDTMAA